MQLGSTQVFGLPSIVYIALDAAFFDAILSRVTFRGLYTDDSGDPFTRSGFSLDNLQFDVQGTHSDYTVLMASEPGTLGLVAWMALRCMRRRTGV